MDTSASLPLPAVPSEPVERDLAEIDAAIGLVSHGIATRVLLASLAHPDRVAATGLAHAQAAHVAFTFDRTPGTVTLTIGPRT